MPNWPQLDPVQQNELLEEATGVLLPALPPWWQKLMMDFSVVGRTSDLAVGVLDPNGTYQPWSPPVEYFKLFQRLRKGMYRDGEGTWWGMRYTLTPPSRYAVQYNWKVKPSFPTPPSPEDYDLEQRWYPRIEAFMPDWYRAGLAAAAG